MGSGINTTFRQVGIATGVAGLGAVFQSRIDSKLAELLPGAHHGLGEAVASGGVKGGGAGRPSGRTRRLRPRRQGRLRRGFNEIVLIAAIVSFAGALAGFVLVRSRDFVQPTGGEAPQPVASAEPVR